jgi:hypothetical protein
MQARDPSGNTAAASATTTVDGTPPTVTRLSPERLPAASALVVSITDAWAGVRYATLSVDGDEYDSRSLAQGSDRISYRPQDGWTPGDAHTFKVQTGDQLGNEATVSGRFTVAELPLSRSRAAKDVKRALRGRGFSRGVVKRIKTSCRSVDASNVLCRLSGHLNRFRYSGTAKVGRRFGKRTYDIRLTVRYGKRSGPCTLFKYRFTHRNRAVPRAC